MTDDDAVPRPVAETRAGIFRGAALAGVDRWLGIRYAEAPVGERRWRAPVPAMPVDGVVDAVAFGPAAPQERNTLLDLGPGVVTDEDCLFLNVWRPRDVDGPLPVMVWIHGGAYAFGAASQPMYDGTTIARDGQVVVVTVNYRLGGLGFLELAALDPSAYDGNLALRDVLTALRWVQESIAAFGGDPARVTVFGESAGGGIVTTLLATPSASGLFHRAIAQSSPASSVYGTARAATVAERFLELAGTTAADARALASADVVAATMRLYAEIPGTDPGVLAFAPVADGDLVPEAPIVALHAGRGLPVPLVLGTNRDEASLFASMKSPLMPITEERIVQMFRGIGVDNPDLPLPDRARVLAAYAGARARARGLDVARDVAFRLPTLWVAEGHSAAAPTWLYRFDHSTPSLDLLRLGATHGAELAYVFGTLPDGRRNAVFLLGGRRVAERLSARMAARWTAFAHGGAPDAPDAPAWPAYDDAARRSLVIDGEDRVVDDLDAGLRAAWGDEVMSFR